MGFVSVEQQGRSRLWPRVVAATTTAAALALPVACASKEAHPRSPAASASVSPSVIPSESPSLSLEQQSELSKKELDAYMKTLGNQIPNLPGVKYIDYNGDKGRHFFASSLVSVEGGRGLYVLTTEHLSIRYPDPEKTISVKVWVANNITGENRRITLVRNPDTGHIEVTSERFQGGEQYPLEAPKTCTTDYKGSNPFLASGNIPPIERWVNNVISNAVQKKPVDFSTLPPWIYPINPAPKPLVREL